MAGGVEADFFRCSATGVDAAVEVAEDVCDLPEKKLEKKEDGLVIDVEVGEGLAARLAD